MFVGSRSESGVAPILVGAAKLLVTIGAWLGVEYAIEEAAAWGADAPEGDEFCAVPLTQAQRAYWAEAIAKYKATADAKIAQPFAAEAARARIDEVIEQITDNPEWSVCHVSASAKALWDMIDQVAAMGEDIDPDAEPPPEEPATNGNGNGNGDPEGQADAASDDLSSAPYGPRLGLGLAAAVLLIFLWSRTSP